MRHFDYYLRIVTIFGLGLLISSQTNLLAQKPSTFLLKRFETAVAFDALQEYSTLAARYREAESDKNKPNILIRFCTKEPLKDSIDRGAIAWRSLSSVFLSYGFPSDSSSVARDANCAKGKGSVVPTELWLVYNDEGLPSFQEKYTFAEITASSKEPPMDSSLVVEGKSIGQISLGDRFDDVLKIFPFRKNYDAIHTDMIFKSSNGTIIRCADLFHKSPFPDHADLFFYFENNYIVQIEGSSPSYHLPDKVQDGAKLVEVVKYYPNAPIYILKGSGGDVVGGKDLVYLVDEQKGIAFEFQYSKKDKTRELARFIVFPAGSQFFPSTCVTPPQTFEPSSLDELDK